MSVHDAVTTAEPDTTQRRIERPTDELWTTIAVAAIAVLAGLVVIALLSAEPLESVTTFLFGPFDGMRQIGTTLGRATPYIFTGAALAVSFRVGVFNIGAEGQLYLGALAGTIVAVYWSGPGPVVIVVACVAGAIGGGLWALIPAVLRARFGANEVVLTLMMNFIATLFVSWMLAGPIADPNRPGFPQSQTFDESVRLGRLMPPSTLHLGFVIGIVMCVVAWWVLSRTVDGYGLRMTGENPEFASYVGISPTRSLVIGMVMSGALAGLGGIVHLLGDQYRLLSGFSSSYGLVGILIALLARNYLLAVPFAAVFYGWIISGAQVMEERSDVPREAVSVVQAMLFLLVTSGFLLAALRRRRVQKMLAEAQATADQGAET